VETKCWKKHPELIPDKVKVARKKKKERKSEQSSAAATAIDEGELILNVTKFKNENIKLSQFDINDAYYTVLIKKDIVYLQDIFEEIDKESDNKESDNDDKSPYVTLLKGLTEVEPEVQDDDI
jgi:hypothetical protein